MEIWADKYRPRYLHDIQYNKHIASVLMSLSTNPPHILFHGLNGSGKKTLVKAFLREIYGDKVDNMKIQTMDYQTSTADKTINAFCSNYHIEINPSESGNSDYKIIQDVIKELTNHKSVALLKFRVMIIENADQLSNSAQNALKSVMEKNRAKAFRIIFIVKELSKINCELQSRCKIISVPSPTTRDIKDILLYISTKEHLNTTNEELEKISNVCDRNLMRACLILQGSNIETEWQKVLNDIVKKIINEPSMKTFICIREILSDLLANCIPHTEIFDRIAHGIIKSLNLNQNNDIHIKMWHDILDFASYYEHTSNQGTHALFSIEAFILRIMKLMVNFKS